MRKIFPAERLHACRYQERRLPAQIEFDSFAHGNVELSGLNARHCRSPGPATVQSRLKNLRPTSGGWVDPRQVRRSPPAAASTRWAPGSGFLPDLSESMPMTADVPRAELLRRFFAGATE